MRRYVYLAGPITGCTYGEATDWREGVASELMQHGIGALNPLRGKLYLMSETSIADSHDEHLLSTQKAITTRDRWDCMRADVVLMNFIGATAVSKGSLMELGWADAARNPIVLAMESGNIHDHAMVREVAGYICPDLEEAVFITKTLLINA